MSKELAASGQLSAEDIERIRSVLTGNRIQAYKAGEQGVADVMTRIIDFQFNTLCDMALRSLTAPTNTPNGDRQELIDKCLDAGRDEGIEAAAKACNPDANGWNNTSDRHIAYSIRDKILALKGQP